MLSLTFFSYSVIRSPESTTFIQSNTWSLPMAKPFSFVYFPPCLNGSMEFVRKIKHQTEIADGNSNIMEYSCPNYWKLCFSASSTSERTEVSHRHMAFSLKDRKGRDCGFCSNSNWTLCCLLASFLFPAGNGCSFRKLTDSRALVSIHWSLSDPWNVKGESRLLIDRWGRGAWLIFLEQFFSLHYGCSWTHANNI